MNNAGEDRLLTFQEVRDYLRISRPTLLRLVQEDKLLVAIRVGYEWRFRKSDVEAYLKSREGGRPSPMPPRPLIEGDRPKGTERGETDQ